MKLVNILLIFIGLLIFWSFLIFLFGVKAIIILIMTIFVYAAITLIVDQFIQ
jgi:hypothetical protein